MPSGRVTRSSLLSAPCGSINTAAAAGLAGFDTRVLAGEADLFGVRVLRLAGLALEAEFGPGREDQLHLLLTVLRLSLAGRSARRLLRIGGRRRRGLRRRRLLRLSRSSGRLGLGLFRLGRR